MNSARIEARTNIKFTVNGGWRNGEIIYTLQKVYGLMPQRNQECTSEEPISNEMRRG